MSGMQLWPMKYNSSQFRAENGWLNGEVYSENWHQKKEFKNWWMVMPDSKGSVEWG